jgi:hypothetical protein
MTSKDTFLVESKKQQSRFFSVTSCREKKPVKEALERATATLIDFERQNRDEIQLSKVWGKKKSSSSISS